MPRGNAYSCVCGCKPVIYCLRDLGKYMGTSTSTNTHHEVITMTIRIVFVTCLLFIIIPTVKLHEHR